MRCRPPCSRGQRPCPATFQGDDRVGLRSPGSLFCSVASGKPGVVNPWGGMNMGPSHQDVVRIWILATLAPQRTSVLSPGNPIPLAPHLPHTIRSSHKPYSRTEATKEDSGPTTLRDSASWPLDGTGCCQHPKESLQFLDMCPRGP